MSSTSHVGNPQMTPLDASADSTAAWKAEQLESRTVSAARQQHTSYRVRSRRVACGCRPHRSLVCPCESPVVHWPGRLDKPGVTGSSPVPPIETRPIGHAPRDDERSPDGDARATNERLATGRPGARAPPRVSWPNGSSSARRTHARPRQSGRPSKFARCAVLCRAAAPAGRGVGGIVGSGGRGCGVFGRTPPAHRSDAEEAGESRACDGVAVSSVVCSSSRYGA
jgi:hypothetical protein